MTLNVYRNFDDLLLPTNPIFRGSSKGKNKHHVQYPYFELLFVPFSYFPFIQCVCVFVGFLTPSLALSHGRNAPQENHLQIGVILV